MATEEPEHAPGQRVARAAAQVIVLFILSRALGLAREMVIGAVFGTSAEYDAYLAAVRVPDILFTLIAGGALGSAFIPTFTGYFARGNADGGWRLASAVVNLLVVTLALGAILIWAIAPFIVTAILAPGFPPDQQRLTVSLMRTMLVAPILFGVSGVVMGVLNARQHFILPALAPSLLNLSLIGAAWLMAPRVGVHALAFGYVAGAFLHLTVQLPGLIWVHARYSPLTVRHPGVREVLWLMAPRVLGLAAVQLNFLVNTNIASRLGEGAVSALNYAWLLMLLPQGIFAQAVATAAFPTFAEQAAQGKKEALGRTLSATLRSVFFLTMPAAVGLIVLRRPVVALLFERGAFQAASTDAVAWALAFYAIGLIGHAAVEILARAFYALHDTWTPVRVGVLAMAFNVALSLTLPRMFAAAGVAPHGGLALANSVATLLEMVGLAMLVRPRLTGLAERAMATSLVRSTLAAAAMTLGLVGWLRLTAGGPSWLAGGGGIVVGAVTYLAAAAGLRVDELRSALGLLIRRWS